jgi:hypothetical protein
MFHHEESALNPCVIKWIIASASFHNENLASASKITLAEPSCRQRIAAGNRPVHDLPKRKYDVVAWGLEYERSVSKRSSIK